METRYPSHEMQHQTFGEWRSYLERFPWEWHATLTVEDGVGFFKAMHLFERWRLCLVAVQKLRVGAYLISASKKRHIHFHVLMVGRNRFGKCLRDCDPKPWEAAWNFFARIKPVTSIPGVCNYVALHFLGFKSNHTEIESFDRTLLRQVMTFRHDGCDGMDGLYHGYGCDV